MPNKFTGKEWDDDFGLNWHHFDWRPYDGEIGRWLGVDPLLEKYPGVSPYNYTLSNPIKLVDPDGKAPGIRTGYVGVAFNKYLGLRNSVINRLNQRAARSNPIVGARIRVVSAAIEFLTPGSLAEQYSSSAIGIAGTGLGSPTGSKFKLRLTKSGKLDRRSKLYKNAVKTVKESVAETKDVTRDYIKFKEASEGGEKFAGSKEATGILDAVDVALKSKNVKKGSKNFFQKIINFFKKGKID